MPNKIIAKNKKLQLIQKLKIFSDRLSKLFIRMSCQQSYAKRILMDQFKKKS